MWLITREFDGLNVTVVEEHFGDDDGSFEAQLVVRKILK